MGDDHLNQTFDVLLYGLHLRDRVARGERPHLGTEQGRLKGLLGAANQPAPWGNAGDASESIKIGAAPRDFLGIRYALTCWLDETMIEAGWREWDENKLESALYRSNTRYSNFWAQARLAEADPAAADAPEAFLLCTLLGFRGELGETPDRLREWAHATRTRISRRLGKEPPSVPEKVPEVDVAPLVGADRYRRMTQYLVVGVLFGIPVVAFLLVALAA